MESPQRSLFIGEKRIDMTKIEIPEKAAKIIKGLESHGFEAFAVGGCVRDALLGRKPKDWDITTDAHPSEIKEIFNKTVDTGLKHGTVTVLMDREGFEVTTYRVDGDYSDGRHPDRVSFTPSLSEDLKRRDFTVNAMAYSDSAGLVDEFGGIGDLSEGIIRCVGKADDRFNEDALRMMRAVRFSAVLGFDIEKDTFDAIKRNHELLKKISAERIFSEFIQLLTSKHPERLYELYESGLTEMFLPEFDAVMRCEQNTKHHIYPVGVHTVEVVKRVREDKVMRLAALMHDLGKPVCKTTDDEGTDHFHGHPAVSAGMASSILQRLKSDNDTIDKVKRLVLWHDARTLPEKPAVRRLMAKVGAENLEDLFELQRADVLAQSEYKREEKLERIAAVEETARVIREEGDAVSLAMLKINGRDLIDMGIERGPGIGRILELLLEAVMDAPEKNEREQLLLMAKVLKDGGSAERRRKC